MMETDETTGEIVNLGPLPPKLPPLDLSHATPELFAALAVAQAKAATVGKDANNQHGGYKYATADAMIRAAREARAAAGLALFTTWSFAELDVEDWSSDGQWPCAIVTLHFVLAHGSGGWISGKLSMHAIGSRRRPPDKAIAAAATYGEGFIERGLMRLDRADDDEDDVDRREEGDTRAPRRSQQRREQPQRREPSTQGGKQRSQLGDCGDADALAAWIEANGAAVLKRGEDAIAKVVQRAETLGLEADSDTGELTARAWVERRLEAIVKGEAA